MSIVVSIVALIIGALKESRLAYLRGFFVFFALGSGQIHLAVLALVVYLFTENGYRFPRYIPKLYIFVLLFVSFSVFCSILLAPRISYRMLFEALQAMLYLFIFLQFYSYIKDFEKLYFVLQISACSALAVAVLAISSVHLGFTNQPHIFLARGGNEGSLFLLLMGVLPASTLFLSNRGRAINVFILVALVYAQYLATSRANLFMSFLIFCGVAYFLLGNRWLKTFALLLISICAIASLSLIQNAASGQANASFFERVTIYQIAWDLWMERPWFGWGYGSTSELDINSPTLKGDYPHFHATHLQFVVEQGMLGLVLLVLFFYLCVKYVRVAFMSKTVRQVSFYLLFSFFALISSSFVEALHFGADRAVQLAIVVVIQLKMLRLNIGAEIGRMKILKSSMRQEKFV